MNITCTFDTSELEADLVAKVQEAQPRVIEAMIEQTHDIVMSNFGPTGVDRPLPWAPLSNRAPYFYAQQVGRPFATLYETGAMAGAVKSTVVNDGATIHGKVSLSDDDCRYATRHHFGDPAKGLPIRRVFPINLDDTITEYTNDAVTAAAVQTIEEALR